MIWGGLPADWELSEREQGLLKLACSQVDRAAELDAAVDAAGLMTRGSAGQVRVHPGVAEARQCALAAGRLLGMLSLPDGADAVPMTIAQTRARRAAEARYGRRVRARGT
jgi:hypothetical protein